MKNSMKNNIKNKIDKLKYKFNQDNCSPDKINPCDNDNLKRIEEIDYNNNQVIINNKEFCNKDNQNNTQFKDDNDDTNNLNNRNNKKTKKQNLGNFIKSKLNKGNK